MRTTQTTLEAKGYGAVQPPVSGPLAFRLTYNQAAGQLLLSVNGGAYAPIGGTGVTLWQAVNVGGQPGVAPQTAGDWVFHEPGAAAPGSSSEASAWTSLDWTAAPGTVRLTWTGQTVTQGAVGDLSWFEWRDPTGNLVLAFEHDLTANSSRVNCRRAFKQSQGGGAVLLAALAATYTISIDTDPNAIRATTVGAGAINLDLPPEEEGLEYILQCDAGSPGAINVRDDAAGAVVTLNPGQIAILRSVTAAWMVFGPWNIP